MQNLTVLQTIAVSMGTEPISVHATFHDLSKHECVFMGKLIKEDVARAKKFRKIFRLALNDGG